MGTENYDRDKVRALEREIELEGDNRFQGWKLSSEKDSVYQMPMELGGDWAWADFGIIRDGFPTREAAIKDWKSAKGLPND